MKLIRCLLSLLIVFLITVDVLALPPNEIPMYGGINKTEEMKKADADLIAGVEKAGYSRQSAAQEAVRKAWIYFEKGDFLTAMKRFNQAWLLDPENGDVYHGFALIVHQRDNAISEAEKYFHMALSKSRVSVNAYVDYGRFLWLQKRYDESLTQLNKALEISPKAYNARAHISFVYYKKGDFVQACKWGKAARANNDQLETGYLENVCSQAGSEPWQVEDTDSKQVPAADCRNEWLRPSSQTMSMGSAILFMLTDYKNKERHFSMKQGPNQVDVYYLKGILLVKGYSEAQIEKITQATLFWMPMAFSVPTAILGDAEPKGPCNVGGKMPFSIKSSGAIMLQNRKISGAVGQLFRSTPSEISYEFDVSFDPPAPQEASVRYAGTMSFAPQEESLSDDTDITGYMVVRHSPPFPVAGSPGVPAKLGELRRLLASGQ